MEAVRALYGVRGGDYGLYASMGLSPEQIKARLEAESADLVLWPESRDAVAIFADLMTQWRDGLNGKTGIDYSAIPVVMRMHDIAPGRHKPVFDQLRTMEIEALKIMNERKSDGR